MRRASTYFGVVPQTFDALKDLEDEIRHYRRIKVTLRDIYGLEKKIREVRDYPAVRERLRKRYGQQQMTFDELEQKMTQLNSAVTYTHNGQTIKIEHIAQHYYLPTLLAESERADYIQHIIKVRSEVDFVNYLNSYVQEPGNLFEEFNWWLFSKLDEHLDDVSLPYYDPETNRMRQFNPDFVFWLQREGDYYIVFIDPKGTAYTAYQHKIAGYRALFEDDHGTVTFEHDRLNVKVFAFLRADDANVVSTPEDRRYWFDGMETVLDQVLEA
jgi:hypothetical protein